MDRERLIDAGVDYDEGVERFGGQPELFEKYLQKFFDNGFMAQIEDRLENKDMAGAFRITHDLKGAAGNLSLTRFFDAVCRLTEKLRPEDPNMDCKKELRAAQEWYEKASAAVGGTK